MRFTWLSNAPFTPTGYGQQTGLLTPRLVEKGYPIAVIANFGHAGSIMDWKGVRIYGPSFDPYGMDVMYMHTKSFGAEFLLTLMDLQVFSPENLIDTKWVTWMPIDHHNIPPVILANAKIANYRIAMSKHGQSELERNGLQADYIPCVVDTSVYRPIPNTRKEMGFPEDKFIVGMVAMNKGNPSRKSFHENIAAFAALKAKHSDVCMYLHAMDGLRGGPTVVNLIDYIKTLGLSYGYHMEPGSHDKDVIFSNQYGLAMGYDPQLMAKMYSAMDVLTEVTRGEGFGIPVIEAQACGVPVIVGDWAATAELCYSGWKLDKTDAEPLFTPLNAWQYDPHAGAIAERMESAYQMKGNLDYRKRAIAGAQLYDVERVIDKHWIPTLEKLKDMPKAKNRLSQNLDVLR